MMAKAAPIPHDLKVFEEVISLIRSEYLALLQSLYLFMEKKAQEAGSNG